MPKGYHHLTYDQRCQIQTLKERGDSINKIAEALKVHRSSIYREIARNSKNDIYEYHQANKKAIDRRHAASSQKTKMTPELIAIIKEKLKLQWSPEQISGRLKRFYGEKAVSHEMIYRYIWDDKQRRGELYKNLRHHGKKYNKRGSKNAGRGFILNRIDIDQRPLIVEEKSRIGDWEIDTIIGKSHKGAIVSMVDRHSKFTMLAKVSRKTAYEVEEALITRLSQVQDSVYTITSDNGKEFANHVAISKELEADFYFAHPYHSWERGLNEHTNGLVRQYVPKSTDFDKVSTEDIRKVEDLLNDRPRKVLKFSTPLEIFTFHMPQSPPRH
jgi:IS30 family transposase